MLDDAQKTRIRSGFASLGCTPDALAHAFYDRLFEVAPAVRPMFTSDIKGQAAKLGATLNTVLNSLDDLEGLAPTLRTLGVRHGEIGAQPEHYEVVGDVLLEVLKGQIADWTEEDRSAWAALYGVAAGIMVDAAEEATGGPDAAFSAAS